MVSLFEQTKKILPSHFIIGIRTAIAKLDWLGQNPTPAKIQSLAREARQNVFTKISLDENIKYCFIK